MRKQLRLIDWLEDNHFQYRFHTDSGYTLFAISPNSKTEYRKLTRYLRFHSPATLTYSDAKAGLVEVFFSNRNAIA